MRKHILFSMAAAVLLMFGLPCTGLAQTEKARLDAFFKAYLEQTMAMRPLEATRLGDHRYDHLLDDLSAAAQKQWLEHARATLAALPQRVNYQALNRSDQIDYEILRQELGKNIWQAENTRPFEQDPRVYNAYLNESVYLLLTQSTLSKETNVLNSIARMQRVPRIITAARENLKDAPRIMVETAIRQNRGAISFYETEIFVLAGETTHLAALKEAAKSVVATLKTYQEFLEKELLPQANGNWRLGKAKFAQKLELELDAGLTAEQVLADAESEFVRVERDMYVIARQLWSQCYPRQALPPDDPDGRRDTIRQVLRAVAREHGKPETLFRDAKATTLELRKFISDKDILKLPDPDRCQVIEMPEFQRGNSTAFLNSAPPLDPQANSFYAVSPPPRDWDAAKVQSYLEEYNRHMMKILSIHEAYPGHYVQLEYSNREPSPIRKILQSGVFIEGWAVYTEQMMLDQGYGEQNPALRLTQLKFYLRAVANAILDHRMHCTNMSDEEAMKLLVDGAFQSEGEARLKVIRAKQSSAQLSTYFVGRMAIYRQRQKCQREWGARFNLGRFHEALLSNGSVPVKYLPELMREAR